MMEIRNKISSKSYFPLCKMFQIAYKLSVLLSAQYVSVPSVSLFYLLFAPCDNSACELHHKVFLILMLALTLT